MNKLDEIVENIKTNEFLHTPRIAAKKVALEFAKHILEEAAENAKLKVMKKSQHSKNPRWKNADSETEIDLFDYEVQYLVNKKSITDTLNKYL